MAYMCAHAVNCTRLLTKTHLQAASTAPGAPLEQTERRERALYNAQLDAAGGQIMFVPFIVDEYC